ncbi:MAG: DUF6702 family protein [Pricia sp.]
MNILKKTFLIVLLPLMAFSVAHKFYVSVTNVTYSEKDTALQITSRIFIDDFENALQERYDFKAELATKNESKEAHAFIEKYLRAKFAVAVNGEMLPYTFIGKKYDVDVMICYIEVPDVDLAKTTSIEIENEILTDIFDEQQNIVHFKIDGRKKSFVLLKSNTKGMFTLTK